MHEFIGVYSGRLHKDSDIGVVWKRDAVREVVEQSVQPEEGTGPSTPGSLHWRFRWPRSPSLLLCHPGPLPAIVNLRRDPDLAIGLACSQCRHHARLPLQQAALKHSHVGRLHA